VEISGIAQIARFTYLHISWSQNVHSKLDELHPERVCVALMETRPRAGKNKYEVMFTMWPDILDEISPLNILYFGVP
jgi:hypothetical protein